MYKNHSSVIAGLVFAAALVGLAPQRAAASDVWISPGQTIRVTVSTGWFGHSTTRVNFANITGPGTSYKLTVSGAKWMNCPANVIYSWRSGTYTIGLGSAQTSSGFTTFPGGSFYAWVNGLSGGNWFASDAVNVTLTRVSSLASARPASGFSQSPTDPSLSEDPSVTTNPPTKTTTWGALKAIYR